MRFRQLAAAAAVFAASIAAAPVLSPPAPLAPEVQHYVKIPGGRIALTHVRVIDGTGAAPTEDQTVLIDGPKIAAFSPRRRPVPAGYQAIDLTGASVIPGLVGMHNHLYLSAAAEHRRLGPFRPADHRSANELQRAAAVSRQRGDDDAHDRQRRALHRPRHETRNRRRQAGRAAPRRDRPLSRRRPGAFFIQNHPITSPDDARKTVAYWADQGVNSFKAYMNISRAALKAAIDEAHRHHLKVTGHLCSVTYPEAAELGIDNLEHGFFVNTQLDPGKQPDKCPDTAGNPTLLAMKPGSRRSECADLAPGEAEGGGHVDPAGVRAERAAPRAASGRAQMDVLTPQAREAYLYLRNLTRRPGRDVTRPASRRGLQERSRPRAAVRRRGGLLIAGPDPTGNGGVIPGFGDQREIELLVEAGFTPVEAIRIATLNGATYLGLADRIGSIAPGKNADLVVIRGNPVANIADIEKVETVFKDGVGYDSAKLLDSVKGRFGQY